VINTNTFTVAAITLILLLMLDVGNQHIDKLSSGLMHSCLLLLHCIAVKVLNSNELLKEPNCCCCLLLLAMIGKGILSKSKFRKFPNF